MKSRAGSSGSSYAPKKDVLKVYQPKQKVTERLQTLSEYQKSQAKRLDASAKKTAASRRVASKKK